MNLSAIREQRAGKVGEMRALLAKAEAEKRNLTAAEQTSFDALKAAVTDLEGQETRAQFLVEAERRMQGVQIPGSGERNFDTECRAFSLTRAIAAQLPNSTVDAGREREISQELARRSGRSFEGFAVPMAVFEERVFSTTLPAGGPGSSLVPTDYRPDLYIDRLRNAIKVRQLGATVLSNLVGNVDVPRLKASTTTGWVAENAALTASDPQAEKISLTPKHCGALVEYSRNMIQQASPDVEQLLRGDMAKMLAEAVDLAAINGSGASNQPRGILQTSGIGSVAIGANGGPITFAAVIDLIGAVETVNAMGNGFLTNAKVTRNARRTLKTTADTASNFVQTDPNTLAGYPVGVTNLVPSNLVKGASGAVCSALIFGPVVRSAARLLVRTRRAGQPLRVGRLQQGQRADSRDGDDGRAGSPAGELRCHPRHHDALMQLELRTADGLTLPSPGKLVGYAAVFDSPADLGEFVEVVRPGAFSRSLQQAGGIVALYDHERRSILGKVSAGTLQVKQDSKGLAFEIQLPDTSVGRDLAVLVERGDVSGCSFGFVTPEGGDRWEQRGGKLVRELLTVDLREITITPQPAYPDTSVAKRSMPSFWEPVPFSLHREWFNTL